jgi:hypothetical protein
VAVVHRFDCISIKVFVTEKKSATEKKKELQKLFINEIEHQTS